MQNTPDSDSRSPPQSGGVITRASTGPGNDTAQPSLTSGFGSVIEKEHGLQSATECSFGHVSGDHAADIDRILRQQHSRLSANIALLEQRYEALPNPERFASWHNRSRPPAAPRRTPRAGTELLPNLIAQHNSLLADIESLIACAPDGQRGELILTEVGRNHEEMAWMLAAVLRQDETVLRGTNEPSGGSSGGTRRAQENWDNEGGPVRLTPPAS